MIFDDETDDNFLNSKDIEEANKKKEQPRRDSDADDGYITFHDPDQPTDAPAEGPSDSGDCQKRSRRRRVIFWSIAIILVGLAAGFYLRYCNPVEVDAKATGYLTGISKRGVIFKTFEGELIPDARLADSTRVYSRDFQFSIPDDSLALRLQKYQEMNAKVTVTYERYPATLPWRGASKFVVTAVAPANSIRVIE